MKRLILFFSLLSVVAFCGDVVLYDPVSSPITNKVIRYSLSVNPAAYPNATNMLWITNRTAQSAPGVTVSNLTTWCVVDGGWVRLMTQAEADRIAATNAIIASNNAWMAKYEARVFATNVINGSDGLSLYIRAMGEANWFLLNRIQTNLGYPALTKGVYKTMIDTNIANFGQ